MKETQTLIITNLGVLDEEFETSKLQVTLNPAYGMLLHNLLIEIHGLVVSASIW